MHLNKINKNILKENSKKKSQSHVTQNNFVNHFQDHLLGHEICVSIEGTFFVRIGIKENIHIPMDGMFVTSRGSLRVHSTWCE